jgi:hypothetical protein
MGWSISGPGMMAVVHEHWHRCASAGSPGEAKVEPDFVNADLQEETAPSSCSRSRCK